MPSSKLIFIMFIALFGAIGFFATDIYLPAMPKMVNDLNTSDTLVQMSISVYMIFFSVFAIFFGFFSDIHGRKQTIRLGLITMIIASIICFFSSSIYIFLFGRIVQAIGAAAVVVPARALLPDHFRGEELLRSISATAIFVPFFLAIAPFIGGYIQALFSWRHVFTFLIALFFIMLYYNVFYIKNDQELNKLSKQNIINSFALLKIKEFVLYALYSAIYFSGIASYLTIGPFLFQNILGMSTIEFSWMSLFIGIAVVISSLINMKLTKHYSPRQIISAALLLPFSAIIIILLGALTNSKNIHLYSFGCFLYFFAAGFSFPNSIGIAYNRVTSNRGFASSFITFSQLMTGSLASFILSYVKNDNFFLLASTFGAISFLMAIILIITKER